MVKRLVKAVGASAIGAVLMFGAPAPAQAAVLHYVAGYASNSECVNHGYNGHVQGVWNVWQCRHPTSRYYELWADDECRICLASVAAVRVEE
jgi:hypothetical protein